MGPATLNDVFTLVSTPMRPTSAFQIGIGEGIVFRTHNLDAASAVSVDHGKTSARLN
jgi:hypothetical protein